MPDSLVLHCSRVPFCCFVVARSRAVLGRSTRCDFVVDDRSVSREHAEIGLRPTGPYVIDLGSRNGTFVDDRRIRSSELKHGQVVQFGATSFEVLVEGVEPGSDAETDDPRVGDVDHGNRRAAIRGALSEAQRKVFDLLTTELAEKTIARQLELSPHTVHNHVRAIFRILGVHSRPELFAMLLPKADRSSSEGMRASR
jgi:pSer/pThr/pTyr-binding forkhead associated (FHA) protein